MLLQKQKKISDSSATENLLNFFAENKIPYTHTDVTQSETERLQKRLIKEVRKYKRKPKKIDISDVIKRMELNRKAKRWFEIGGGEQPYRIPIKKPPPKYFCAFNKREGPLIDRYLRDTNQKIINNRIKAREYAISVVERRHVKEQSPEYKGWLWTTDKFRKDEN